MNFKGKFWLAIAVMFLVFFSFNTQAISSRIPDVHFVPTPQESVEAMLKLAGVGPTDVLFDLGSGDGRFVTTAVQKFGARKGVGVDIDPVRIREANENALRAGVANRAIFLEGDLFEADIRAANVVTLYLLPSLNIKLRPILLRDLRPGTRVISYAFDMADWTPDQTGRAAAQRFMMWIIPARVEGNWNVRFSLLGRTHEFSLDLAQRYQEVTGSARSGDQVFSLTEPRLNGERLSFALQGEVGGVKTTFNFDGVVSGNMAGGAVSIGGATPGKAVWSARRKAN